MVKKHPIAVLISGRGSNFEALLKATFDDDFPANIACVISNKASAKGLEIAKKNNIPTFIVTSSNMENQIDNILNNHNIELICLAGFMRILSKDLVKKWENKIINIHPSLLPAFKGLNAQKQALEYGVKITGCTAHYVTENLDDGEIIIQSAVQVLDNDTVETLSTRILKEEHQCLSLAVKKIFT